MRGSAEGRSKFSSQRAFAQSIGVALGTLQGWEQGRRKRQGPARVLLTLTGKRPGIVREELAGL
jgi:putative transcriptional regulator